MDNNEHYTCILYTDGSFKLVDQETMTGHRGCGIHGYMYKNNEVLEKPQADLPPKVYTTTLGYNSKPEKLVKPIVYIDQVVSCANLGTNITAELEAVIFSIENVLNNTPDNCPISNIHIWTDSMYVIDINRGISKGNYSPKANPELVTRYAELLSERLANIKLEIHKSEAHTGDFGNEIADDLSKLGRELSIKSVYGNWYSFIAKNYWKNTVKVNPMLNFKQLYFSNSQAAHADEILYHVMDYSKDVDPGKKEAKTSFGLIRVKEPEELISSTISRYLQESYNNKYYCSVYSLNLQWLYNRRTIVYWNMLGNNSFLFDKKTNSLTNANGLVIARPVVPTGLATQALDRMKELYTIIRDFEHNQEIFTFKDITDMFYNTKGVCILPKDSNKLKVDVKSHGEEFPVYIELGIDTLSANSFKQMVKEFPNVYLVTKPNGNKIFAFYTLVKTGDNIGIYTNFYTSKVYVTK